MNLQDLKRFLDDDEINALNEKAISLLKKYENINDSRLVNPQEFEISKNGDEFYLQILAKSSSGPKVIVDLSSEIPLYTKMGKEKAIKDDKYINEFNGKFKYKVIFF